MSSAPSLEGMGRAIDELRDELTARHGWTHLEVSATLEPAARRIVLHGEVAVDRLAARVVAAIERVAMGWSIDAEGLRSMSGGSWHALPGPSFLLGECPGLAARRRVATELRLEDGPVQRLGVVGRTAIVRGRDGTVGWLEGPLGPVVEPPRASFPRTEDPRAIVTAARPWLAAPYRLGGVSEDGVDCSGLVQRLALDVLGSWLPRHSSDQLLVAPRPGLGLGVGDLSFVWSDREALCHVGVGTGPTVIHASLSRRRVVEDAAEAFVAGARRVMHVPFGELLALGRRVAGHPSLTAAGFRLGRELTG